MHVCFVTALTPLRLCIVAAELVQHLGSPPEPCCWPRQQELRAGVLHSRFYGTTHCHALRALALCHQPCALTLQHLVVWGHEHESLVETVEIHDGIHITQPGSTVATSLIEGEVITTWHRRGLRCIQLTNVSVYGRVGVWACGRVQAKQKNVALLQLRLSPREDNDGSMFQYMVRPLPLTCVRPFYLQDNIALGAVEHLDRDDADARGAASEYLHELVRCSVHVCVFSAADVLLCRGQVEKLVAQAAVDAAESPDRPKVLTLPLIRLKVRAMHPPPHLVVV